MDEFLAIKTLLRPLTLGAPEALELMDDAAVIPGRAGYDLIVTKDAMVEGVHFLPSDPENLVARKLIRVNLSDLAAKGADPYGYFLAAAWPSAWGESRRAAFASGLADDQARYALKLFGGDTVSTPGPLTLSVTLLGWAKAGSMIKRTGAKLGDLLVVSGTIGDGVLGLSAAKGEFKPKGSDSDYLADRYRLPQPRLELTPTLLGFAHAAADVSDGLLADAAHIALASNLGLEVELDRVPLSGPARRWILQKNDRGAALAALAAGGDDYEIVCAVDPDRFDQAAQSALKSGVPLTAIGRFSRSPGLKVTHRGEALNISRAGWVHGGEQPLLPRA